MTDGRSHYERWVGDAYKVPFIGSRPRPPRGWPVVIAGCIATWLALVRISPLAEAWRIPAAIALAVTGAVLTVALLLSMLEVAERVHRVLLRRPELGDWRIALWLLALVGFAAGGVVVAGLLALVASA